MGYKAEKIVPYSDNNASKGVQVGRMFDEIAGQYDLLNHTLSFGIDKFWRRKGILSIKDIKPSKILDIATGTGDLAIHAYRLLKPESILAVDISERMMEVGRQKVQKENLQDKINFQWQDCMDLRLENNSFDAAMVAFGIRNFENLDQGLKEILRVLRPGGKLMILELSTPEHFPMKQAYKIYSKYIIPAIGRFVSGNKVAYDYLPASIKAFPQNAKMKSILEKNGFTNVRFTPMTFGICTLYIASKS